MTTPEPSASGSAPVDDGKLELEPELAASKPDADIPPLLKLSDLLSKHKESIDEMVHRARANPEYMKVLAKEDLEVLCLRYFIGKGYDLEKAWAKFLENIKWREAHIALVENDPIAEAQIEVYKKKIARVFGVTKDVYKTKDGRVLNISLLGRMRTDEMLKTVTLEEYEQATAYNCLHDIRYYNELSRKDDVLLNTVNVVDMKGVGLGLLKVLSYVNCVTVNLEIISPECNGMIVIINAPSFFNVLWRVVKPTLDANTIKKVRVFGAGDGAALEFLRSRMDPEVCPFMFGGLNFTPADAFLEEFDPPFSSISVPAGAKKEASFEVDSPSEIIWKARPKSKDVNIEVYVHLEGKDEPKLVTKVAKASEVVESVEVFDFKGKLTIIFDNSYSYLSGKTCFYYFRSQKLTRC